MATSTSTRRIYMRHAAAAMRQEGKSLGSIAKFLEIEKKQVSALLKEYERCEGKIS